MRVWLEQYYGISGFEVTFSPQSDFTGHEPIVQMFGE